MGQLALSVTGAIIGAPFGLSSQGWLVGSALGAVLFPPEGTNVSQEGSRLGDLAVTASTYGQPIPLVYGTVRTGGNVIWGTPIEERKKVEKESSGGKGGAESTSTTTTYSYFASFAVAFSEGPIDDILRIWADGKLLYDKTGTGNLFIKKGVRLRIYKGNETQLPDSLIEADKGVGSVPAHRGLAYVIFEQLPLADTGNRRPNITAEVTSNATAAYPITFWDYDDISFDSYDATGFAEYDFNRKTLIHQGDIYSGDFDVFLGTGLVKHTIPDMELVTTQIDPWTLFPSEDRGGFDNFWYPRIDKKTGFLYCAYGLESDVSRAALLKIDPNSLLVVDGYHFGSEPTVGTLQKNITSDFARLDLLYVKSPSGNDRTFILTANDVLESGGPGDEQWVGIVDAEDMSYIFSERVIERPSTKIMSAPIPGREENGFSEFYFFVLDDTPPLIELFKVTVQSGTTFVEMGADATLGVSGPTLIKTWDLNDLMAVTGLTGQLDLDNGRFIDTNMGVYDPDTDALLWGFVLHTSVSSGSAGTKWIMSTDIDDLTSNWVTETDNLIDGQASRITVAEGNFITTIEVNNEVQLIDKYSGNIDQNIPLLNWSTDIGTSTVTYDSDYHALIRLPANGIIDQFETPVSGLFYLDRVTGAGITLKTIVDDQLDRGGVLTTEISTSELTPVLVPGLIITRTSEIRRVLENLAVAYRFDLIESDFKLTGLLRGRASSVSVPEDDLASLNNDENYWEHSRGQEQELPARVFVNYMDPVRDYEQGTQLATRQSTPFPVMFSKNDMSFNFPLVMDADPAKQLAEILLFTAWHERDSYSSVLPWKYLAQDPADVIDVTVGGTTYNVRITTINLGANLAMEIGFVADGSYLVVSSAISEDNFVPNVISSGDRPSFIVAHNVPLLADTHDQGRLKSLLYIQAGPLAATFADWSGTNIYVSPTGLDNDYIFIKRIAGRATYGSVPTALVAPLDPFIIDVVNTLIIWPADGEENLASITEAELLAGDQNMLIIGDEVLNFQNVTDNMDGSYTIDTLMRGRRGTDVKVSGHVDNEQFYLMAGNNAEAIAIALGDLNKVLHIKAVGSNEAIEEVTATVVTPLGYDLFPYAPVQITRTEDVPATGDSTLDWVRRTRIIGDLVGGTGVVPLSEDSEEYEVDLLDAPGGSVVRTYTGLSTPTVVYTDAQKTTDSFSGTLHGEVFQISAQVGRGFAGKFSLV